MSRGYLRPIFSKCHDMLFDIRDLGRSASGGRRRRAVDAYDRVSYANSNVYRRGNVLVCPGHPA